MKDRYTVKTACFQICLLFQ